MELQHKKGNDDREKQSHRDDPYFSVDKWSL